MNANIPNLRIKTWALCLFLLFATISCAHPPFDKSLLHSTSISSITNFNSTTASTTSSIPLPQLSIDLSHERRKPSAANAYPPSEKHNKQEELQKSYEGDGISSGQPPPGVNIQSADNSAAKKLIPVYVVAGVFVLIAGIAVCWGMGRKHRKN